MADGSNSTFIELAKYPVTVLSIFLALAGAKYLLGVRFDTITKISSDGVEFSQEAKGEIASLATQVNALSKTVDELRKETSDKPLTVEAKAKIAEAAQTVSNQTADLASVKPAQGEATAARGYIWIGDYDAAGKTWSRIRLVAPNSNQAVSPSSLTIGGEYVVSANLVMRDGQPRNDDDYYRSLATLGVVRNGTRVRLLSAPVAIDRGFAVQYWVQVEPVK